MASQALTCNGIRWMPRPATLANCRHPTILRDPIALKRRAEENGYLFIRRLIPPSTVLEARREILLKYATVGEIDNTRHDVMDGVRGSSYITQINLDAFVTSLRTGACYERVVLHPTCWRCMPT